MKQFALAVAIVGLFLCVAVVSDCSSDTSSRACILDEFFPIDFYENQDGGTQSKLMAAAKFALKQLAAGYKNIDLPYPLTLDSILKAGREQEEYDEIDWYIRMSATDSTGMSRTLEVEVEEDTEDNYYVLEEAELK
eukprot:TRINITY_DN3869_c2_g1_i1.p3 TRINITY_DN3869_c2_g1~~TRINITY_DN3869_c2_g1_i1.p3  ORF type:complete len:136 (+),score=29.41 TRINITY_DN3869_c2_g1_i1:166-573(+)